MNILIPFNKDIKFDSKIAEITSISLEQEMSINEGGLLGNFIVSGEYKSHNLSVNSEEFSYTLPFDVSLKDNIDLDTVELNISDFTYDIENDNILKVFIEFRVLASEKPKEENIFEKVTEDEISIEDIIEEDRMTTPETIVSSINQDTEETYVTYHIHIVKETDTIDSIIKQYNSSLDVMKEYNDINNISIGDKLLIPDFSND